MRSNAERWNKPRKCQLQSPLVLKLVLEAWKLITAANRDGLQRITCCDDSVVTKVGYGKTRWWWRVNGGPLLFQCWATVYDGGPAMNQHWVNVSRRWLRRESDISDFVTDLPLSIAICAWGYGIGSTDRERTNYRGHLNSYLMGAPPWSIRCRYTSSFTQQTPVVEPMLGQC